jgi:hypothetical protein
VQNAIDGCRARIQSESNALCKITITKPDERTLVIVDNGMGMDYVTAKNYLSIIGDSYYSSKDFADLVKEKSFEPIAMFGIGILSAFLICDGMIIETKKKDQEGCKFTIGALDEDWKYQVGKLEETGTKIILQLNEFGKGVDIEKSLQKYFISPEIDVYYQNLTGNLRKFESAWSASDVMSRFCQDDTEKTIKTNELCNFGNHDYELILARSLGYSNNGIFLFSHGVFITEIPVDGLNYPYFICLNTKRRLFDLHISRENVIFNERWNQFLELVFDDLFIRLFNAVKGDKYRYIDLLNNLVESRFYLQLDDKSTLFEKEPFLKSLMKNAIFPTSYNNQPIEFHKIQDLPHAEKIRIYQIRSSRYLDEISLILDLLGKYQLIIINPFKLPTVRKKTKPIESDVDGLTAFLSLSHKTLVTDLNDLLIQNSELVNMTEYGDIIPDNIKLVKFPNNWRPVVLIKQPAEIVKDPNLGSSYWGEILLWKRLLPDEQIKQNLELFGRFEGFVIGSVKSIAEPIVYIDSKDEFIAKILFARKDKPFSSLVAEKVTRYFRFVAYLPLALSNFVSSVIFLDVISELEKEISRELGIPTSESFVKRFKPEFSYYLEYFDHIPHKKLYITKYVAN